MDRDVRRSLRATEGEAGKLTPAVVALWTIVGLIMGVLRVTLTPDGTPGARITARMILVAVIIHWFWIPVTPLAARVLRWSPWTPGHKRRALAAHAVVALLVVLLEPMWTNVVVTVASNRPNPLVPLIFGQSDTNVVFYALVVATLLAMESWRESIRADLAAVELEEALANSQVELLTMQLQPHFVFNALHAVSETVFQDVAAARRMLADLRALLAESCANASRREVTVREELAFLDAYVAIQQQRFRERLRVTVRAAPATLDAAVPHLLLQPLVENAIRHGLASRARGGEVRVDLRRDGDTLIIDVIDDGVGLHSASPGSTQGLGLSHTRRRLAALHGEAATLMLRDLAGQGTHAQVTLPFHTEDMQQLVTPREPHTPEPHMPDSHTPESHTPESHTQEEFAREASASSALPEAAPAVPPPRAWRSSTRMAAVAVAWALVAILWAQLGALSNVFTGVAVPTFTGMLQSYLVITGIAAVLSLPVWHLMQRAPLARDRPLTWLAHLLMALVTSGIHCALVVAVLHTIARHAAFAAIFAPLFQSGLSGWIAWDSVVYGVALAIANRNAFLVWHRRRYLAAATATANIARARLDLMRLRLQPAVLLAGIDAVAAEAAIAGTAVDASRCEEMIARLGDLLRRMLRGESVEREQLERELRSAA